MGFLDKLKSIKNVITGGAAEVYIDCEKMSFDEPFRVVIRATTDDAPVKISRVYLKVVGNEEVNVPDVDIEFENNGEVHRKVENVQAEQQTVNLEITVAEEQELAANQTFEWEVEVELPSNAPQIYKGHFCQHIYVAQAGLDCFGNDPDSGWVELNA